MRSRGGSVSGFVASPPGKTLASVADLKDFASSSLNDLKRHLDHSHTEILKEFEASHSRLQKRYKAYPLFDSDAHDSRYRMQLLAVLFVCRRVKLLLQFLDCTFIPNDSLETEDITSSGVNSLGEARRM